MESYLHLLEKVYHEGKDKEDRTGTGTRSLFGEQLQIKLSDGFPLLTTKKVSFKNIVTELLWMLRGDTNLAFLHEHGCRIWDEWADENGDLGPVYGKQWRNWSAFQYEAGGIYYIALDQISRLVKSLRTNPDSRRHIVTAWNPGEVGDMALPPCHCLFQCYVCNGYLSLQMYQRSADLFLGVPYNIASYALLTHLLARVTGLKPHKLIICFGDVHIYKNHFEQVEKQLSRSPRPLPDLKVAFDEKFDIFGVKHEHISLFHYHPHPAIPAPVSV
jgi:thymidylate synthase